MRRSTFCPHCGKINWTFAPLAGRVFDYIKTHQWTGSSDIVKALDTQLTVASQELRKLYGWGLLIRRREQGTNIYAYAVSSEARKVTWAVIRFCPAIASL